MEEIIQNSDLEGSTFVLPGVINKCIILIHGFTATTVEVRPLAEYLNQKGGFHIYAPLLPGHGTSPSDLNNQSWKDWVGAVEEIISDVCSKFSDVYIGGESMGGVLSCLIASRNQNIKKIVLFSPALKVKNLGFTRLIRLFKNYIPKSTANKNEMHEIFPWQGYKVNPTQAAYQLLKLQKTTSKLLPSISQPVLIFNGLQDRTIAIESAMLVYMKINSIKKELVHLRKTGHTIILDQEFDFVARKTLEFLIDIPN